MKLLLVEDEKDLSRALVTILKYNHYTVDAVDNGEDALNYIQADEYDAVILDVMIPKKNGIDVLKEVRASGNHVPILLLTAKSETDDKVVGLDAGADDYLTKPFETKELLARLRAATRRKDQVTHVKLSFGNVELYPAKYELVVGGQIQKLPNREYQMMELLMQNPGVLISTDTFMEKIWGYESEAEINVVWAYISYLRKKLYKLQANIEIVASRGVGYTLKLTEKE